jgi:O-antigen/teichoic acid export membrane protein
MMMWLQVAEFFVIIIAALFKMNILPTAILFSIANIFFYIFSAVYVKSLLPQYFPWWKNGSIKIGILNILKAGPLTLGWAMTQGGISALILLISSFLTPAAIPAFTTLRTISNLWMTLINSFTTPMIPEAVRFHATGQLQKLISINNINWVLISAIINLSLIIIYPFIGIIFKIWTAHHLFFDKSLLSLLLATIVVSGMGSFMGAFLSGINTSAYIILSSALRGGIALLLSWILLPIYGTVGLGVAILIAEILVSVLTNFWFFQQIIDKIGGKILLTFWSWISSLCVVLFLISQCFHIGYTNYTYGFTLFMVVFSSILAWHSLDQEIKTRVKSLVLTRIRSSK